jgi:hypothetical protein
MFGHSIFEQKVLHFMTISFEMVYLYKKHIVQHCSDHFIVVKMNTNDTCMMFAMCEGMPLMECQNAYFTKVQLY